jgi:hypothetical protein
VSPGHRRVRAGVVLAAAALVVGLTSCASGGGSAGGTAGAAAGGDACNYGCLVPGARVASALSISATDTLPEINPRSTLPARVNNAINQHREQNGYVTTSRCLRRFGGGQVYVVIFKRTCDQTMGPDNEPGAVVGFDANGQVIGQVSWTGPNTVGYLLPDRRR